MEEKRDIAPDFVTVLLKNMVLHDFIYTSSWCSGLAVLSKVIVWVESSGAFNTEHPRRDFFIFFNR